MFEGRGIHAVSEAAKNHRLRTAKAADSAFPSDRGGGVVILLNHASEYFIKQRLFRSKRHVKQKRIPNSKAPSLLQIETLNALTPCAAATVRGQGVRCLFFGGKWRLREH
jgi:hypothetical protein